jgi:TRAP-type C4-dicarboxylate transport system substrate-binding protein
MNVTRKMVLILFVIFIPLAAFAEGDIGLTYANFPPAPTFPCVQMERWAQEIQTRTAGKVKVKTFTGGTLLGAKNMFDGVISGVADIGCYCPSYQPGRFPLSEAIDLPLGFSSAKIASLVYLDMVQKYKPKELGDVKVLTVFTCAPANLMTKTPVRSLADLKGMELRVAGTGADVVKQLGGTPVAMPQSETPDAIQKGVVKGMVSSMEILKDFNFADYCRYATIINTHVVSFAVIMNLSKWNSLPSDVRKVMDDLSRDQSLWTGTYADDHVMEALSWSKDTYGHEVIQLPEAEKAKLFSLMAPVIDGYIQRAAAQGLQAKDIVKDVKALDAKYEKLYP